MSDVFGSYRVEIEVLLTWFPTISSAMLKDARIRGLTVRHSTSEPGFHAGIHVTTPVGQALGPDQEAIALNNAVRASVDVSLDSETNFEIECEVFIGGAQGKKLFRILPGTTTPFMINLTAPANDENLAGTAAVFQGVIVTTQPLGLAQLSVLVSETLSKLRGG